MSWKDRVPTWNTLDPRVKQNAMRILSAGKRREDGTNTAVEMQTNQAFITDGKATITDGKATLKVYLGKGGKRADHITCSGCKSTFSETRPCQHMAAWFFELGLFPQPDLVLAEADAVVRGAHDFYREVQKYGDLVWRNLALALHHVALLEGVDPTTGRANIAAKAYAAAVWRWSRRNLIQAVAMLRDTPHRTILREVMGFEWQETPVECHITGVLHQLPPFSEATLSAWFAEEDVDDFLDKVLMTSGILVREFEVSGSADGTGLETHTKSDYAHHIEQLRERGYGATNSAVDDAEENLVNQARELREAGVDTTATPELGPEVPTRSKATNKRRDYEKLIPFILSFTRICPMALPSIVSAEARYSISIMFKAHQYLRLQFICFDMGYVKKLLSWVGACFGIFPFVRGKITEHVEGKAGVATPEQARRAELQFLRAHPAIDKEMHGRRQTSESYNASTKRVLGPKIKLRKRKSEKRIPGKKAMQNEQLVGIAMMNAYYLTRVQLALKADRKAGSTRSFEMWSFNCEPLFDKAAAQVVNGDWVPMEVLLRNSAGEPRIVESWLRTVLPKTSVRDWEKHFTNDSATASGSE